jgi:hypothetical protein
VFARSGTRLYDRSIVAISREQDNAVERAISMIDLLATEIGPRRPTGRGERLALMVMREELGRSGLTAEIESFRGYPSFGLPFGLIEAAGVAPALLGSRMRRGRSALALLAGAALAGEGSLRAPWLSRLLSRRPSGNLVATVEPRSRARRTLCLMAHIDSSRSGLMFDPRLVGLLGHWIALQSIAGLAQALGEPVLGGIARGRRALTLPRAILAAGLLVLLERELRGVDVPGANDNASGCAVASVLAGEIASRPLESTRLVLVITGCEEAGTLGAQAFLAAHPTAGWMFLNFDNVGGPGPVRFLRREGVLAKWNADPGLVAVAQEVGDADPELRLLPEDSPAGLTYDTSPVHAQGGRGLTLSVQDGFIPDLHQPTDTIENIDRGGLERTLEAGRRIIASVDAGGADREGGGAGEPARAAGRL